MEEFAGAGVLLDRGWTQDYPLGRPLPISDLAVVRIVQSAAAVTSLAHTHHRGAVGSIEVRVRFQDSQGRDSGGGALG